MKISEITLAHEPDAAWIIALWLAIHGGDPGPEGFQVDETAVFLASALSAHLSETIGGEALTTETLHSGAHEFDMEFDIRGSGGRPFPYCFEWKGERICVQVAHKPVYTTHA